MDVRRGQAQVTERTANKNRSSVWTELKEVKATVSKLSRAIKSMRDDMSSGWNTEMEKLIGQQISVHTINDIDRGTLVWVSKYTFKIESVDSWAIYNKGQFVKITPAR